MDQDKIKQDAQRGKDKVTDTAGQVGDKIKETGQDIKEKVTD